MKKRGDDYEVFKKTIGHNMIEQVWLIKLTYEGLGVENNKTPFENKLIFEVCIRSFKLCCMVVKTIHRFA